MRIDLDRLIGLAERFADRKVGVIGDLIADVYQFGRPTRLSREAPVLVVRHEEEKVIPGSAANSAMNLAALCTGVTVVGALGQDDQGERILEQFREAGLDTTAVEVARDRTTVSKTRIMVSEPGRTPQQMIRVDREPDQAADPALEEAILDHIDRLDGQVDGWLVSDYEYGLVGLHVAERLRRCAAAGRVVVVDSRHNLPRFRGVDALCPNREEAEALVGHGLDTREDLLAGGREILARVAPRVLFLTLGNEGMGLFTPGGDPRILPVVGPDQVTDVSGAGDTVAATILLARCAGADPFEAGVLATCAASVVVQKLGAATLTVAELIQALQAAARQFNR